ncbi:MAG: cupin domain-containing protein [Baekduia sp.]
MNGVRIIPLAGGDPVAIAEGESSSALLAVGPNTGAAHRSICDLRLAAGGRTIALRHPGEAVWYVESGTGTVTQDDGAPLELDPGTMIHIGPETTYRIATEAGARLIGGPAPPDPELASPASTSPSEGTVRLFHRDRPARTVPMISSDARLVVFAGVGAETANMNYVRLEPGEENVPHRHASSEDTIVILEGAGTAEDLDAGVAHRFEAGDAVHVPVGVEHRVKADLGVRVVSVGGPCPADHAMLKVAEGA